jgi:hypothetical protein
LRHVEARAAGGLGPEEAQQAIEAALTTLAERIPRGETPDRGRVAVQPAR